MRQRITKGHLRLRGHTWWCQWKYRNHPFQVSLRTKNEREARAFFSRQMTLVQAAILDGTHDRKFGQAFGADEILAKHGNDILLIGAWPRYLRSVTKPDTGESTVAQYALQFGRLVTWTRSHKGPSTIRAFTKQAAREFASDLAAKVGAATFNKYMNLYRLVFRVLLDELDVPINPWEGIQRKKTNGNGRRSFTAQEIAIIFGCLDRMAVGEEPVKHPDGSEVVRRLDAEDTEWAKELRTLCKVAYHTGMRFGDCSTLVWSEVALDKDVIVRVPNKTGRRHPDRPVIIPLTQELSVHMRSLPHGDSPYVCPRAARQYLHNNGSGRSEATDRFMRVLTLAGIRAHKAGTGKGTDKRAVVEVGFHSFRHTWVTTSAEAGVDPASVRAIVGWGSPAMERVYTHVGVDHLRAAMAKRASVAGTTRAVAECTNGKDGAAPAAAADSGTTLDGMDKGQLELLKAAIQKRLEKAEGR